MKDNGIAWLILSQSLIKKISILFPKMEGELKCKSPVANMPTGDILWMDKVEVIFLVMNIMCPSK